MIAKWPGSPSNRRSVMAPANGSWIHREPRSITVGSSAASNRPLADNALKIVMRGAEKEDKIAA
jgi:hypothetical protein